MNYNMQKLKLVFGTCIEILNDVKHKYEDGKLSVIELVQLTGWIDDIVMIGRNIKQYKDAYLKLSAPEKSELINWFNNQFDLNNDKTEKVIEQIFGIIISLNDLISFLIVKPLPEPDVKPDSKE